MAAAELHKKQEVYIKLIVDASDYPVPCGDYPFLIVERTIVGMRKEVRIVPISEINLSASDFCDLLEAADYKEIPDDCTDKQWEKLSQLKREQQQQALAQLTIDVKEKCDYRRAAVLKSYQSAKKICWPALRLWTTRASSGCIRVSSTASKLRRILL